MSNNEDKFSGITFFGLLMTRKKILLNSKSRWTGDEPREVWEKEDRTTRGLFDY
jgi:hypothetical protein